MIIDTSAILAILLVEPDARIFAEAIEKAKSNRLSAANYLEASVVIDKLNDPVLSRKLDEILRVGKISIETVTEKQARIAREAYRDFGRGTGHPAQLNFGDCFAYALASDFQEPLLFKGNDFSQTDIKSAI